jgi:hypothetical protein
VAVRQPLPSTLPAGQGAEEAQGDLESVVFMRCTKKVLLVLALQLILAAAVLCAEALQTHWLANALLIANLLVPFAGYILALHRVSLGFASFGPARWLVLTLISFAFTVGGGVFCWLLLAFVGMPVRG